MARIARFRETISAIPPSFNMGFWVSQCEGIGCKCNWVQIPLPLACALEMQYALCITGISAILARYLMKVVKTDAIPVGGQSQADLAV